jgi:hypothetical protein
MESREGGMAGGIEPCVLGKPRTPHSWCGPSPRALWLVSRPFPPVRPRSAAWSRDRAQEQGERCARERPVSCGPLIACRHRLSR